MNVTELAEHFPHLWHVTFAGGWEGIERRGLLRAADVDPEEADVFRPEVKTVGAEDGSEVTLRDQVCSRADPTSSLDGITPAEWWNLINSRVYFFQTEDGADKLRVAYLSQGHAQEVLKIRTQAALQPVADDVEVTTVNAGVFPRTKGPSRGPSTFMPLADFPVADVKKIREVTVAGKASRSRSQRSSRLFVMTSMAAAHASIREVGRRRSQLGGDLSQELLTYVAG